MDCIAYIDGGRIPGTKRTTVGGVLMRDDVEVARYSEVGGVGSNTDAEWQSLIRCLQLALEFGVTTLHIRTDARVVSEMLHTEYQILRSMIADLELNPCNNGLRRALAIRTKESLHGIPEWRAWIERNRTSLEATYNLPAGYRAEILAAMARLKLSVELVPREANAIADGLCRSAREHDSER